MDNQNPSPQFTSPYHPHVNTPKAWYRRRITFVMILLALLVIVVGTALYKMGNNSSNGQPSAKQHLTLYYNDSKTILWQTSQPEADNAAYISYVRNELKARHGQDYQTKGDWKVTTTLDKRLQDTALAQIKSHRSSIAMSRVDELILIAEDAKTGQIVSLATQQPSQKMAEGLVDGRLLAGTLAIPFNYIALLEKFPARTNGTFDDGQMPLPGYPCTNKSAPKQGGGNCLFNMDMRFNGPLPLNQALGGFRNVPAVRAWDEAGRSSHETAAKMGSDGACYADLEMTEETICLSAAAFGDGLFATPPRLLQAYATLANQGFKLPQTALLKTTLNGKQQYAWKAPQADGVISSQTARTISGILADPTASFIPESRKAAFTTPDGKKVAIASGYTQQSTLASSVQFTDRYVVGFWGVASNGTALIGNPVLGTALPIASGLLQATE